MREIGTAPAPQARIEANRVNYALRHHALREPLNLHHGAGLLVHSAVTAPWLRRHQNPDSARLSARAQVAGQPAEHHVRVEGSIGRGVRQC